MKVFKYNRWLVLVIVIGLLAALAISFQRNAVERANRQVDLAIDYEGLQERSRTLPGASSLPPARSTARKSTSSVTIHRPIKK